MSYIVFCTFDLKNANSQDYAVAYSDLQEIGLQRIVISTSKKEVVIPTTSTMGEFNGTTASAIRDHVKKKIEAAFNDRGFESEILS